MVNIFLLKCIFIDLVNVTHYRLSESVCGASYLMSQINIISVYLCIFEFIQTKLINNMDLFLLLGFFLSIFVLMYLFSNQIEFTRNSILDHFRTFITLLFFGYGFTPLIR